MKKIRFITAILFLSLVAGGMTSCEVGMHTDNGRHRGWFHKHDEDRHEGGSVILVAPVRHDDDHHDNHE